MRTPLLVPLGLALSILSTPACKRPKQTQGSPPQPVRTTSAAAERARPIADKDVTAAVARVVRADHALRFQNVEVATSDGIVTLTGTVDDLRAKKHAESAAETIKGVRSVIDRLGVTPVQRTDDQIRAELTSTLRRDPATRDMKVGITVRRGVITATGTADSWVARKLITEDAEGTPGVSQVINDVALKIVALRPTAEILAEVRDRLASDAWLDGSVIGAAADGRTVRLSGIVGSLASKQRAHHDAAIIGVESVDDRGLIVDWSAQNKLRRSSALVQRSDDDVKRAVLDAFKEDPRLARVEPGVTVQSGTVTLTGAVDSAKARLAAENDARNTLGAWNVVDHAVVAPAVTLSDADVERGAKRALTNDPFSGDTSGVNVHAQNGKVILTGTAKGDLQRLDIDSDVGSVPGVKSLEDDLAVGVPPRDVRADIDAQLFWDPLVDSDEVHVALGSDGVATLTGDVDTWGEAWAATHDALAGGATRVVNLLKVKGRADVVPPGARTP